MVPRPSLVGDTRPPHERHAEGEGASKRECVCEQIKKSQIKRTEQDKIMREKGLIIVPEQQEDTKV
jgi:hypothetical protein